jgi:hypothetical protein
MRGRKERKATGLGEVLDQVRRYYLDRLVAAAKEKWSRNTTVILEPALRDSTGAAIREGELQLPLRKDLAVLKKGAVEELLTIDTEGMVSFEPVTFNWGDNLRVSLGPFHWQCMVFRMPRRKGTNWQALEAWFWSWFHQDEDGGHDQPLGAVHFLSDPAVSGKLVTFETDLGSAPVEAFEELLDAVSTLGLKRCEIGQA